MVLLADTCWPPFPLYGWCSNTGSSVGYIYGFLKTFTGEILYFVFLELLVLSLLDLLGPILSSCPLSPNYISQHRFSLIPKGCSLIGVSQDVLSVAIIYHISLINLLMHFHSTKRRLATWLILTSFSSCCSLQAAPASLWRPIFRFLLAESRQRSLFVYTPNS